MEKNLILVVFFLLLLEREIKKKKKSLTLVTYFLHLETPGLPSCYPLKSTFSPGSQPPE